MKKHLLYIWLLVAAISLFFTEFILIQKWMNPLSVIGLILYGILLMGYIIEYREKKREAKNKELLDTLLKDNPSTHTPLL